MGAAILCPHPAGLHQINALSVPGKALVMALWLAMAGACCGQDMRPDLVFVGDINLGRLVEAETAWRGASPWREVLSGLPRGAVQVGNLEGVVARDGKSCLKPPDYCLFFPPDRLKQLSEAGFTHLGLANNHALDQGSNGLADTRRALSAAGMAGASLAESPYFVSSNGVRYGLVFINRIADAKGEQDGIPSPRVAQALELAKFGADWVIAYIHWGQELTPWANQMQRDEARWLVEHGADMVVGSHPHVIQPADCVAGHPVWFSLGNHIFDQKYPSTHRGGLIACEGASSLVCKGYQTKTRAGSAALEEIVADSALDTPGECIPARPPPRPFTLERFTLSIGDTNKIAASATVNLHTQSNGRRHELRNLPLRRIAPYRLADGTAVLFLLLELYSDLDRAVGLRPHVYRVEQDGIRPLWRGSGLAFPLIDAIPVSAGSRDVLCALHAGGSFLTGMQNNRPSFVMAYQWNGFGFSAERDEALVRKCQDIFGDKTIAQPPP